MSAVPSSLPTSDDGSGSAVEYVGFWARVLASLIDSAARSCPR